MSKVIIGWLGATALAVVGMLSSVANAQVPAETRYCFKSSCFGNLYQAEALMRSQSVYGDLLTKKSTRQFGRSTTSVTLEVVYEVKDQPPEKFYESGYSIGSHGPGLGYCGAANIPYANNYCRSEDETVHGSIAYLNSKSLQCTYTFDHIEGSYPEPHGYVARVRGGVGYVAYNDTGYGKQYQYSAKCLSGNEWTHGGALVKHTYFDCPVNFDVRREYNPALYPGKEMNWPNVCYANGKSQEVIYIYDVSQTQSCPINQNPCFPATGDKARAEEDFSFAGRLFTRYYHSLGQIQSAPELGVGWSHSYSGNVSPYAESRLTEQGYLQTYRGDRGSQAAGETLRMLRDGTYVLVEADGESRLYDTQGRLTGLETGVPTTSVTISYDTRGRIDRITDRTGRFLSFGYDHYKLTSITLPDGSKALYSYDAYGNLTNVVRPDGSSRSYLYAEAEHAPTESRHLLTGIIEGDTRYATFSYNANAKVTGSELHADGSSVDVVRITYNSDGTATSTNNLGEVRQHTIGGGQYRAITKTVDSLGERNLTYDAKGRLTSKADALGNVTTISYVDRSSDPISQVVTRTEESIGRISRVTRNADNRVVEQSTSQKIPGGEQLSILSRQVHDAQGRLLFACQYDVKQPVDYVCGSLATAPVNVRQVQNIYCTDADVAASPALCPLAGLQLSERDPAGALTRFEYYAANDAGCDGSGDCRYRKGDLWAEIDPLGRRTEYLEYDAAGRSLQVRSIDGLLVERLYDASGRVLSETIKGDVPSNDRIRLYEYNSTGQVTRIVEPDGVWTKMHYDTANRLVAVEDAAGNRINYVLDAAGNQVREEVRDTGGLLKKFVDRTFDTTGRMTRIAGASGDATLQRYDANSMPVESEDPLGMLSRSAYDGAGRVTREVRDVRGIAAETRYEYGAGDRVERVVDPKGLSTTYTLNGFGELESQTSPDTGTTRFTHDKLGNVLTRTDARGVTANYRYDSLSRLLGVNYPDPGLDIAFSYDVAPEACAPDERFAEGRLGIVLHAGGSTSYCHDQFGQITSKVQTVNGITTALRYAYDKAGRLTQLVYPDGSLAEYIRDNQGHINQIDLTLPDQGRQVVVTQVAYAPFGPPIEWTYGNSRKLQRPLDLDYRPLAVHDSVTGGLSLSYDYDPIGSITAMKSAADDTVLVRYGYDSLGRLAQTKDGLSGVAIESYRYDATGNRTSLTTAAGSASYVYPADSHRLIEVNGQARNFDAAGNTISIGDKAFMYNDASRMGAVKQAGAVIESYVYNHLGERVLRLPMSGSAMVAAYDEGGRWIGNYIASGQPQQQAIWLDNYPVGLLNSSGVGLPELAYIQPDHLGTPRVVIDPARNAAIWEWSSRSEVFGNQGPNADPDGDGVAFELALRFPGQQTTNASGMFYNYQRDYDPVTGRYSQSDPIGLVGGISSYAYAGSSPTSSFDPYGLFSPADLPSLPDWVVDGAAGFGDGLTGGATRWIRDRADIGSVDYCSSVYQGSEWAGIGAGLAVPAARLGYVSQVGQLPKAGLTVEQTVAARNALKAYYRGRPLDTLLPKVSGRFANPTAEQLLMRHNGDAARVIEGAGRTSNQWTTGIVGGSAAKTANSAANAGGRCGCN